MCLFQCVNCNIIISVTGGCIDKPCWACFLITLTYQQFNNQSYLFRCALPAEVSPYSFVVPIAYIQWLYITFWQSDKNGHWDPAKCRVYSCVNIPLNLWSLPIILCNLVARKVYHLLFPKPFNSLTEDQNLFVTMPADVLSPATISTIFFQNSQRNVVAFKGYTTRY